MKTIDESQPIGDLVQAIVSHDLTETCRQVSCILFGPQPPLPGLQSSEPTEKAKRAVLNALRTASQALGVRYRLLLLAYGRHPDLVRIASSLAMENAEAELDRISPVPFLPAILSKAKRFYDAHDAWQRAGAGDWLLEPKWDGWELQVHVASGKARLFGRSGRELTSMAPTVVDETERRLGKHEIIFHGELLPLDPDSDLVLPRTEIQRWDVKHRAIVFDLLFLDGDCTRHTCQDRHDLLQSVLGSEGRHLMVAEQIRVSTFEQFNSAFHRWETQGMEGMIAKRPHAIYETNLRTANRLKIKRKDSVDAVIIGYCRFPQTYLVGIWDGEQDEVVPFAWVAPEKDILAEMVESFVDPSLPPLRAGGRQTHFRLRPALVVELDGDHIFPTKHFSCGMYQTGQGWSLFSPTLVRVREEKTLRDVTTVEEFLDLPVMAGHLPPARLRARPDTGSV